MTFKAPVAIFCYRRPEHLRRTLQSLMQCEGFIGSQIYIFADGPRCPAEVVDVNATRQIAQELLGTMAVYRFSEQNRGLSHSIISGVGAVLQEHDRVIVVEDDLVLDRQFLKFLNGALDKYIFAESVFQVSGHMFNVPRIQQHSEAMFLPFTTSWGWATWRRAWQRFDTKASGWERLAYDSVLRYRFNLGDAYDYATMLERQMNGQCDSWAIRWYWSVFVANGLVVYPPQSLVQNSGFDGSGTHGRGLFSRFGETAAQPVDVAVEFPEIPGVDTNLFAEVADAVRQQNGGWRARCVASVRRLLGH